MAKPADYLIDFHCWQDWSPPGVLATTPEGIDLGKYVGISWIHYNPVTNDLARTMLAKNVCLDGRVGITVEFTPQTRIVKGTAELARWGVENVMRRLKMLPGRAKMTRPLYQLGHKPEDWKVVKAKADVIVTPTVEPGDWVSRGEVVARLAEVNRPSRVSVVKSPINGIVGTTMPSSAVRAGDGLMVFRRAKRLDG